MDNILFIGFADNKIPEFKEVKSKDWVLFGEDNKFPEHLIYLYNKSSNHNAIINGKVIYIIGKGYETGTGKVNSNGETFNEVLKKLCIDIELFGGCYAEVIWKNGGGAEVRHLPFQSLRRAKGNNGYWYSKNWAKYNTDRPVFIPDFNENNRAGVHVLAYKEYRPGTEVYPLPGYFGALNDIETDVEISKYNLSVIKNGMFSSKMIVFNNGQPTKEIKSKIEADFKKKFTGSENGGNFMLVFNEDPAKAPTVQDLSTTDLDKLFDQLNKTTQAEIFSGHLVTSPMLFGIMEPGKLGGRNELQDAYEIFKKTYVAYKQEAINNIAKMLMPLCGIAGSELIPVDAISLSLNPVDFKDMLPKEWVFEQLGIDIEKYHTAQALSKPDITEEQVADMFSECGEAKTGYTVIKSFSFDGSRVDHFNFADISQIDSDILNMLKKDKRMSIADIAAAVSSSADYVQKRIDSMLKKGIITQTEKTVGVDKIIETAINPEVIDYRPDPETVDVFVKYTYEKRPEAKGPEIIETTRPFCKRLIELDRVYTRNEIETISQRLGYSVFDRAGGFWGKKGYCRHEWRRLLVIKKK